MTVSYAVTPVLNMAFLDTRGYKASGGIIRTYKDNDRSVSKATYQDKGGLVPYPSDDISTYIPLNDFGETPGLIYLADDEPYYMEVRDANDGLIDYYEGVTPGGGGGAPVTSLIPITNHILNGQFRFYSQQTVSSFTANDKLEFAPKWFFTKNNTTATDSVKIISFPMGGVAGVPANPDNYVEYTCSVAGTGETSKSIFNKILDVTTFQEEQVSFSFVAKSPSASPVELVFVQDFGAGGTPSPTVSTNVATFTLTNTWARYTASFTVPSVGAMTKGTSGDDNVQVKIALPLNTVGTVQFTNVQIERGALANPYQYRTYDIERALLGLDAPTISTGDVKLTIKNIPDSGWVMMNDQTIGNATSGATGRANADTRALFRLLWGNCINADAPVDGGRGASADADFDAGKTIQLLKAVGRALCVAGQGDGLTDRQLGSTTGSETVTLTKAQLAPHLHTYSSALTDFAVDGGASGTGVINRTTANTGDGSPDGLAGQAHPNMQPSIFLNVMIKL